MYLTPIQRNQSNDHETKIENKSPLLLIKLFKRTDKDRNEEAVGDRS